MRKVIDLLGKRFGKLIVINKSDRQDKSRSYYWLCKCDCGNEKIILGRSLKSGNTKSCGCYWVKRMKEIHNLEPGLASKRKIYKIYKEQAKNRKLIFDLSFELFLKISQQNCHYCGLKPSNRQSATGNNGDFIYSGLDRKDNSKGYTLDNVVPCCKICNRAKNNLSYDSFIEWTNRIKKFNIA